MQDEADLLQPQPNASNSSTVAWKWHGTRTHLYLPVAEPHAGSVEDALWLRYKGKSTACCFGGFLALLRFPFLLISILRFHGTPSSPGLLNYSFTVLRTYSYLGSRSGNSTFHVFV